MKSRLKKLVAQGMVVLALTTGISVVGGAANAEPAEAARLLQCRLIDAGPDHKLIGPSSTGRYATYCFLDYGLDEEILFWWFAKDGFVLINIRDERCDRANRVGC